MRDKEKASIYHYFQTGKQKPASMTVSPLEYSHLFILDGRKQGGFFYI